MEAPEPTCPAPPARDQQAPAPGPPGAPGGQASPRLTLGPVLLPPEHSLAPTVFLKALPIPLYHTVPPGGLQPRAPLVTGSLDGGGVPFLLSPLLQPEGPSVAQVGKPTASTLTVSLVGALPVLSPGPGPTLGSPGKVRNASKYLCPHCGRDCLKPSVLEKHIRSHTGERPFPCAACGIAFKTQSNLYKHRRTQTHLNNSRLSSESEGAGAGLLQEADKAGETSRAGTGEAASERLSLGARLPLGAKDLEAVSRPGSTPADREVPPDSAHAACPGLSLVSTQPRRPQPEQKPCSLQRQQATASEKPWDAKGSEGRLRKCESTDSGYLSRSDSAEQPPPLSSPLHSLSEHSTESEGEGAPGLGPGGPKTEPGVPGASLELEKKRLEERITQLISRNQALVDDPQLDHVRPRKTVLSKQGSIDLPTPYTFKGSFHFDIRALEPGRRRAALGPARFTLTSLDKSRPLLFHSVPTQLSTTVECVPVTRSNSLPLVEGSRTWPEPADPQDACPSTLSPGSPRPTPARLGYHAGLTLADIPGGHPRALVRQAAVEDLPCTPAGDTPGPEEDTAGKRTAPGEGTASKGRAAGRRGSQRRLEMFSQEKWQVYGHETFKRLYQKMKSSRHGGQRAREGKGAGTAAPDLPLPREEAAAQSQDRKSPIPGHVSMGAKQGPWASGPAPDNALGSKPPKQREEAAGAGGSEQCRAPRAGSPPTLSSTAPPCLGSRSPLFPPNGRLEPGQQPPLVPGPLQQGDLETSRPVLPDLKPDGGACSGGGVEETGPWAHAVLRRPSRGSGEPQLPSERKKPKVEGPGSLGTLAAETPGAPAGATSPRSQKQDGDLGGTPGKPHGSAGRVGEAPESPGTSSAAPPAAPRDEESPLRAAVGAPGPRPMAAPQPRAAVHNAFPPKYLLRLPQRETPVPLPGAQGPLQGRDPVCRIAGPKELASVVGPPLTPSPAAGPTPGEAGGISEDPRWCRPRAGRKEEQGGEQEGARTHAGVPAAKQSPEAAPGTSGVTATCASSCAQAVEGETLATHQPCPSVSTKPSGSDPDQGAPAPGLGGPPGTSPEAAPLGPPAEPKLHCPLQPSSFPTVPGWPELALSPHSGTPRSSGAYSPFPSLRAEPRLTWCCLSRSVLLPVEQEKSSSVYLALHFPGGGPQDEGPDPPSVGGVMAQHPASEPEQKKGPPQRRTRMWRGNSKQKKLRINPKSNWEDPPSSQPMPLIAGQGGMSLLTPQH
ncbi:zinc finger protein 831 [Lepus europaeus]|uniref:zinc finger protein 831 n=1 Tax=Lepus europaeus TaxID=9983 RepID=UPI002B466E06|nr:zinc finger protein 831 [Lepus europaeus]